MSRTPSAADVLAAVLAGLAAAVALAPTRVGARRLADSGFRRECRPDQVAPSRGHPLGRAAACVVAAAACVLLLGLPWGPPLAAAVVLFGPRLVSRLEPAAVRVERERLVRDLPLTLDLLAACLTGGASPAAAAAAVADAVGGPCGARLHRVAAALAVGSSGPEAWRLLAGDPAPPECRPGAAADRPPPGELPEDPSRAERRSGAAADDPLAPTARLLGRACEGGAPVAATVVLLAADARAAARAAGERAGRRVGVLVVAPLGLCFLPAFVLLGIVPVVLGLAAPLLASG